jgi:predicted porin
LGAAGASGELATYGAIYNFGFMSLGAGYQNEKANASSVNVVGTSSALQFTKGEGYALTALVPMGSFTPYIKYGERKYSGGTFGNITPSKITNIGVRYALSKRTYLYADYVQNGAKYAVPGGVATAGNIPAPTTDLLKQGSLSSQSNFGITHAF